MTYNVFSGTLNTAQSINQFSSSHVVAPIVYLPITRVISQGQLCCGRPSDGNW